MKIRQLVWKELMERKWKSILTSLSLIFGVGIVVALFTITHYSEKAVQLELDMLGANILVLPPQATFADYYSADLTVGEIPEEYLNRLLTSNLEGLDNLSPKLSHRVDCQGKSCILTGILPKNEFQSKSMWQGAGIFSRPKSCGQVEDLFGLSGKDAKQISGRKRVIETLEPREILVGSEAAKRFGAQEESSLSLSGEPFLVKAILPETGTMDDSRIFGHLHTVQELSGKPNQINAIEVVGCCDYISKGLVGKLGNILPNTKIVTISQIIDTQIKTNQIVRNASNVLLAIIFPLSGILLAKDLYQNTMERRKELGTLLALGASASIIKRIFILKALILGFIGGIGGFILGSVVSLILGPLLAGVPVLPMPSLFILSIVGSTLVASFAGYLPAKAASRLDPSTIIKED